MFAGRSLLLRRLVGVVAMVLGTGSVFGLLIVLQSTAPTPEERGTSEPVAFDVKPPPPPPNKPKPKPKRSPPKRRNAPPPPSGLLAAGVGGLDFGLGGGGAALAGLGDELLGDVQDVVMTDEAVDEQPRALSQAAPEFPRRARAAGVGGVVVVGFLITAEGRVEDARVLNAEPPGWFEDVALEAVRSWSFSPARYQGRPVPVRREVPLQFALQ